MAKIKYNLTKTPKENFNVLLKDIGYPASEIPKVEILEIIPTEYNAADQTGLASTGVKLSISNLLADKLRGVEVKKENGKNVVQHNYKRIVPVISAKGFIQVYDKELPTTDYKPFLVNSLLQKIVGGTRDYSAINHGINVSEVTQTTASDWEFNYGDDNSVKVQVSDEGKSWACIDTENENNNKLTVKVGFDLGFIQKQTIVVPYFNAVTQDPDFEITGEERIKELGTNKVEVIKVDLTSYTGTVEELIKQANLSKYGTVGRNNRKAYLTNAQNGNMSETTVTEITATQLQAKKELPQLSDVTGLGTLDKFTLVEQTFTPKEAVSFKGNVPAVLLGKLDASAAVLKYRDSGDELKTALNAVLEEGSKVASVQIVNLSQGDTLVIKMVDKWNEDNEAANKTNADKVMTALEANVLKAFVKAELTEKDTYDYSSVNYRYKPKEGFEKLIKGQLHIVVDFDSEAVVVAEGFNGYDGVEE